MATLNSVHIIGYLGKDVDFNLSAKTSYAHFSLGVIDPYSKKDDGSNQTDWFQCVAFGKTAEYLANTSHKGSCIFLDGKLKTSTYQTETGDKRVSFQIICNRAIVMSEPHTQQNNQSQYQSQLNEESDYYTREEKKFSEDDIDDILPF